MGQFVIQNDNVIRSARNYAASRANWDQTLQRLYAALDNIQWDDESGDAWREVIANAKREFSKISKNLHSNNELLSKVANKAEEFQTQINANVKKIYEVDPSSTQRL